MRYLLVALLAVSNFVYSQSDTSSASGKVMTDSIKVPDIRERLVQLALQNPAYELTDHAIFVAQDQLHIAKAGLLGLFSAAGNINEFTINPKASGSNVPIYYPRYNFGLSVPFDVFTKNKNNIKIARENYYSALAQKNDKFRQIKAEVLSKYEDYLLAKQLVEFQSKITLDELTLYKRTEKDYQETIVKLEDLDKEYKTYSGEQIKSLTLQRDLNVIKIGLERMIGVSIDDVEREFR